MTGKELYEKENPGYPWDNLSDQEKEMWDEMAELR